jgi:hypothetical protein
MAYVEIDRLTLRVPGMAAEQGHRLAELVVAGLERSRFAPKKSADKVKVELPSSGASVEQLAVLIVVALRRRMSQGV